MLTQALAQGNEDARQRLDTIASGAATLSRADHEAAIDDRLTRKHTQARLRSASQRHAQPRRGSAAIGQALQRVDEAAHMPVPALPSTPDPARRSPPRQPPPVAQLKRYTLSDAPAQQGQAALPRPVKQASTSSAGPSAPAGPSKPRPMSTQTEGAAAKKPGPATFAEMGIESTRLKKEVRVRLLRRWRIADQSALQECVVM
jgi:hypothetical protein